MINENISLSIIFPTLNEGDNLKYLIPEFANLLKGINFEKYELIIIDDGSTDNTKEVVDELQKKETKLTFISRNSKPSLPLSIWEGIEKSKSEYVMWLDADGSMSAKDSLVLIKQQIKNVDSVIIGSRFVDGGAYKGTLLNEKNKLFNTLRNLNNSEDSFIAMYLSLLFNKSLSLLSKNTVKDMTSGFIIGKKEYFVYKSFQKAFYGDYFVYLVNDLINKDIEIIEIGYECGLRKYGVSKTGSSLFQLIKLARPYLKAALQSK